MDSKHSLREDYDARRLGARHDRARDTTYDEARGEWPLEGNYYLALIEGPAYPVPEDQVQATDRFEAGWLVVRARWFELVTVSPRCYKLQTEVRTLVVQETIRLPGIKFDQVVKRSPRLGDSQHYLSEDTHNMIDSCVRVLREQLPAGGLD